MKQRLLAEIVWLDKLLDDFVLFIEKENFKINTNQKILIWKSLNEIRIVDEKKVFSVFSSIIVKNGNDFYDFKKVFKEFFKTTSLEQVKETYRDSEEKIYGNSFLNTVLSSYKLNKYNYNMSVKTFILNNKNRNDRLIRLAVSNLDKVSINNFGLSFNKLKQSLNLEDLENDILLFKSELKKTSASSSEIDEIINKIMSNLRQFKKNIRTSLKSVISSREPEFKKGIALDLALTDLSLIEESAKKLAEKFKNKKSKKVKKSNNGFINIKKTLNKSISYNGVPFERVLKKQKFKKRELIILVDLSDSVKKYSKLILYYIYSLNKFFNNIKTFTFISEAKDISDKFIAGASFEEISLYLNEGGNSDYNSSFNSFNKNFTSSLNRNVIFIIIDDARNNYISPDLKDIIDIQKKVRDLIWLNPENRMFWNTTDSNMIEYQRVIKNSFQIRTLSDLEMFSKNIILK